MHHHLLYITIGGENNLFFAIAKYLKNNYTSYKIFIKITFYTFITINSLYANTIIKYDEIKEDSNHKSNNGEENTIKHSFLEKTWEKINPLFISKKYVGIRYISTLGLSQNQTLMLNGTSIYYNQPYKWNDIYSILCTQINISNALITTQTMQNTSLFYGFNSSFDSSLPLPMQVVVSHFVFGVSLGFGILPKQISNSTLNSYIGIDFLYKQFVFRPFFGIYGFIPFGIDNTNMAFLTTIGLKTFYNADKILIFTNISLLNITQSNKNNIFAIMSNSMPFLLNTSPLRFDFSLGIKYFAFEYIGFNADIKATYLLNQYNVNTSINLGVNYNF